MTPSRSSAADDPAEIDVAWVHYSSLTMMPSFLVCGLVSLLLLTGRWFIEDMRGLGQEYGSLIFFQLTVAVWLVQLSRWLYRGSTYVYRLTNKHLLIDRGFLYDRDPPIALSAVARVEWGCNPFGFFFGVGWVRVTTSDPVPIVLRGVGRPAALAEIIECEAGRCRPSPAKTSSEK